MKDPKFRIGDRVNYHLTTPRDLKGIATIVDIENDRLYNQPRYGLSVDGVSLFIIETPYLWEGELELLEDL